MAKAKKQGLSLAERLEQALVPESEQPYAVPENWIWAKLKAICIFERGITFPASAKKYTRAENLIPCLRTANVQESLRTDNLIYVDRSYVKHSNKLVRSNDIIMSSANSRKLVGKCSFVDAVEQEMTFGGFVLAIRARRIVSKYLFYFLRYEFLSGRFIGESTQTTNIANISASILGDYPFPLPSLSEQQRIVTQIESLFQKLNSARDLVQIALDSFETRKAAVLHKAITGELTASWRIQNSLTLENWHKEKIGNIGAVKGGKRLPKGEKLVGYNTGFPYIRAGDLKNGTVKTNNLQYLKPEVQKKIKHYTVSAGDVYITIVGACIGDVGTIPENLNGANLTENAAKITALSCDSRYLAIFLSSDLGQRQVKEKIASATLGKLSLLSIKSIEVMLPSLPEQQEIVRTLDSLLENEQKAKDLCDILDQIDLMKKTILARAFRGELVTSDPNEESALELLKDVLAETENR